ncbi:NnrS family protein [Thiothrix subterranea]|uniref:NnrS family protein n=1 Tax=Thiothrix subterranea TaxID=2735563 RepID=A0AA51QYX3_9GAMM|nr:NnrS family protein [Thiothrix subterranea]MDQ5767456.1 NnrS family protein [Thiothrix subterranea]WML88673.1 NnrS family protein [Thiothrix subterranea]
MLLTPEKPYVGKYAFDHLGFRPFFLAAGLFAVIGMILWAGIYGFGWAGLPPTYPAITWHAHEMVFGYAVAVAAGFLLTAVKNWTNQQTPHQTPLLVLAGVWLLARLLPFAGVPLSVIAIIDTLFLLWLTLALARPIIRTKQWKQAALVGKIALLIPANIVFYLGLLGYWAQGTQVGLYAGFYLILALIFTMGRRVIPFFIERGVGCPFTANNDVWLDRFSLVLFVLFVGADVWALATGNPLAGLLSGMFALVQVLLHAFRLHGWYHPAIWEKPLLWSLYLAYGWLIFGFLLKFLNLAAGIAPVWIHAFAYGGIAMMTCGMMTRVALGHTGRNVAEPPAILVIIFLLLFAGAFVRVVNAALVPEFYAMWILSAQLLWITAFALFVWQYAPMLLKPRIDGRYG